MKLVNLIPLKEIDFKNQDQFDTYIKQHQLRPSTKVTIAGKVTTAGQAAKNSEPVKGSSVFGKDKGGSVFSKTPNKSDDWMDDLDSIDTSDIKGKADPNADSFKGGDLYDATFKDPETGKTITVGDAYDREDDSPAYQKAFAYVAKFDPDKEVVMGHPEYGKDDKSSDVKSIVKGLMKNANKEFAGTYKLKDIADDIEVDTSDNDGKELQARIDKGEDGVYVQTDETEGTVVFNDGSQYQFHHVEDGPIPVTKVGSTKLSSMIPKSAIGASAKPEPKKSSNWSFGALSGHANWVAAKSGLRGDYIGTWADENGVDLKKVADAINNNKLKPADVATAVSGNTGNKYAKSLASKYALEPKDFDIRSKYQQQSPANDIDGLTSHKDLDKFFKANKGKLDSKYAGDIEDAIGALKYLESDYKRGKADREEVDTAALEIQDLIKKATSKSSAKLSEMLLKKLKK